MLEGGSYTVEITYTVCCEIKAANVCSRPYTTIRNHNLILKAQVLGFSLDSCQTPSCCSVRKIQIPQPLSPPPPPHLSNPTPPPLQPHPLHHPTVHASDIHLAFEKVQQLQEWIKDRGDRYMRVSFPLLYSKQQPGAI